MNNVHLVSSCSTNVTVRELGVYPVFWHIISHYLFIYLYLPDPILQCLVIDSLKKSTRWKSAFLPLLNFTPIFNNHLVTSSYILCHSSKFYNLKNLCAFHVKNSNTSNAETKTNYMIDLIKYSYHSHLFIALHSCQVIK